MSRFVGLMSGTSADAVDAALVRFPAHGVVLLETHSHPFPDRLRAALIRLSQAPAVDLDEAARIDVELGRLFADAVNELLSAAGAAPREITAIGSHGHTVRHQPDAPLPYTWQIGDPNVIAERTGITTVADFRRRDIAAGGQGAPLAPALHRALFQRPDTARAIVNIGGIANITVLPSVPGRPAAGFDSGPGNALMDAWTRRHRGGRFDDGGTWARGGRVSTRLLAALLDDPYFKRPPPKSTGREAFNLSWLERHLGDRETNAGDVQRTLCELTALTIADALTAYAPNTAEVYICGGGTCNTFLLERLGALAAPARVCSTQALGVPPAWVEAIAFAWLAKRTLERAPGNLASATGAAREVILGGIYPG